jgi:hypothetical protein
MQSGYRFALLAKLVSHSSAYQRFLHTAAANGRWCGANGHDAVSAVGLKMTI